MLSLLDIAYEVLSSALCEILKPSVNKLIGLYKFGLKPGKLTMGQAFTMRQVLEKTREKTIDTHYFCVGFQAASTSLCPLFSSSFLKMSPLEISTYSSNGTRTERIFVASDAISRNAVLSLTERESYIAACMHRL